MFEYRISNLIEYRTFSNPWDIRSIEPSNIEPSNLIEYRTFSNPLDIRSVEPSNIEYRTLDRISRYSIDRTVRWSNQSDDRISSMIEYPTMVRWFDIRRSNIELFEPSNIRRFGNPNRIISHHAISGYLNNLAFSYLTWYLRSYNTSVSFYHRIFNLYCERVLCSLCTVLCAM